MNKYILISGIMLLISCNKNEAVSTNENPLAEETPSKVENVNGETLIERSDCAGCHQAKEKMIGPSYEEIAAKYSEKDLDLLADKIINGGSGVWGEVPMAAHSGVTKEDAKKMVEYILTLKK